MGVAWLGVPRNRSVGKRHGSALLSSLVDQIRGPVLRLCLHATYRSGHIVDRSRGAKKKEMQRRRRKAVVGRAQKTGWKQVWMWFDSAGMQSAVRRRTGW